MPVVVRFDLPVVDKASFEKHMKVTATPAQAGSWYWLSSREAHWRPKTYWKAGTKVHVEADLNGVPAGGGRYGQLSQTSDFTIGRSLVAKVNLTTDQMDVYHQRQAGQAHPRHRWSSRLHHPLGRQGHHGQADQHHDEAETIGLKKDDPNYYADTPVKYAMRVTNSGEFLHSAPWSVADQGHRNVSHGCTGMSERQRPVALRQRRSATSWRPPARPAHDDGQRLRRLEPQLGHVDRGLRALSSPQHRRGRSPCG